MAYVSLYRKYRSQSFDEVLGQAHVTTVLRNAIRMGRIAHAYLFCGPRGCGKTSTARLLARALNCIGADGTLEGPTADPCGVCDLCIRIRDGASLDVIEMDAASETGIDDVREKIIENAKYAPGEARFKVYIIDEVHDLSLKAFDSLLKTIEEPPAHVVFVLATTEAHKVPITVRSRCQRMDFRRGTIADLAGNIRRVLEAEAIPFEDEAISAVARAAEGSFRDSLSLLEQALAFTDERRLTAEAVHASIGTVGPELLDEISQTIASDDPYAAFQLAGRLAESGKDVKKTLAAMQAHLRDLLVAGISAGPQSLTDVSPERFVQLKQQARAFDGAQLLRMLDILAESERSLRFTNQHQLVLERALWAILPRHVKADGGMGGRGYGETGRGGERAASATAVTRAAPVAASPKSEAAVPQASASSHPVTWEGRPPSVDSVTAKPLDRQIDLDGIRRIWPRVVKRVLQKSRSAAAYFGKEQVLRLEGHLVFIGFTDEFALARVDKPGARELVEQMLAEELGIRGLKIRCILESAEPQSAAPAVTPAALSLTGGDDLEPGETIQGNGARTSSFSGQAVPDTASKVDESDVAADADAEFLNLVLQEFDGRLVDE